ncbi:MAG: DUF4105 domain-containing protein [Bacteroidales bacterium]|jgi:hypothetical protein|nr:DUF4105 domain-containing protein [Bacteroidales bacterium]
MTRSVFFAVLILLLSQSALKGQDVEIFLITCGPGTATYSIYGHSALRIINNEKKSDLVYNWGVFDFGTPNFVWKFARGRLDYMLGVYPYDKFLRDYFLEERWVILQKINLEHDELNRLLMLIAENMKPGNISYRYDFFYDNCSTRIRDLLEKALGENLFYPPEESAKTPSFRELIRGYQRPYQWLNFGIDLLMGSPADKKADVRNRMFLPLEMQNSLSSSLVRRDFKMTPLLQNRVIELDFESPALKTRVLTSPPFVFSIFMILIIILSGLLKDKKINFCIDIFVFSVFSLLAVFMIFFNFFTEHHELKRNPNIIWLNPFIIMCLVRLISGKPGHVWFRAVFYIALAYLVFPLFFPHMSNSAFVPLILILLVRCLIRSGFSWNPLSKPYLT